MIVLLAAAALAAQTPAVGALVPAGWSIEQRHDEDFNRDGRPDVLLLLRRSASAGAATVNRPAAAETIPRRMLLAALASPRGHVVTETNTRLIPTDDSGTIEDPMAGGEIVMRPAGFDLTIAMLPTTGSYQTATLIYRFRFGGGCFRLVEFNRLETHRASLDTTDRRVNLVSGNVTVTRGNAETTASETTRERLTANPRRCLASVGNGWTFDPR